MKTVADFKRKMVIGSMWNSQLFWDNKNDSSETLQKEILNRVCTKSQSNSFALTDPTRIEKDKPVESWCDWPKAKAYTVIDENTVQLAFGFGRLVYTFIK